MTRTDINSDPQERVIQLQAELEQVRAEMELLKMRTCKWVDVMGDDIPLPVLHWIISRIPVVVWAIDQNGIFKLSEGMALENIGLNPGQVVGSSVFDLYAEYTDVIRAMRRVLGGEEFTDELVVEGHHFEVQLVPVQTFAGEPAGAVGILLEVTRRRTAELTLSQNEQFYQELFEALPVAVISATPSMEIVRINPAAEALFSYKADEIVGKSTSLFYQDKTQLVEIAKDINGVSRLIKKQFSLCKSDGSTFMSESLCSKIMNPDCSVKGFVGIHRDITKEEKEEELRHWHEKTLEAMLDASPTLAFMLDNQLAITYTNCRFAAYLNCSIPELIGSSVENLFSDVASASNRLQMYRQAFATSSSLSFIDCCDGRWFEHQLVPVKLDHLSDRVAVFIHEISERIRAEEQERERIAAELHEVVSEMLEHHHEEYGAIKDTLHGKALSRREIEVLSLIADGLSSKQIAYRHGVSTKTVESQRLAIMRKLRLFTVADLTKYAIKEGLSDLETTRSSAS